MEEDHLGHEVRYQEWDRGRTTTSANSSTATNKREEGECPSQDGKGKEKRVGQEGANGEEKEKEENENQMQLEQLEGGVESKAQAKAGPEDEDGDKELFKCDHQAICDHCDFNIFGVRYKCLNCDDYGTYCLSPPNEATSCKTTIVAIQTFANIASLCETKGESPIPRNTSLPSLPSHSLPCPCAPQEFGCLFPS